MRTQYSLDDVRRRAGGALHRLLAKQAQAERGRRKRAALVAGALVVAAGAGWGSWRVWHLAFAPAAVPAAAAASAPAHQQSGPLANPWGSGKPVTAAPADDAAASAPVPAAAASGPTGTRGPGTPPDGAPAGVGALPPARDALRQALAQLRAGGNAAERVNAALQSGDPAALAIAWMTERHCRQVTHWRQIHEWRQRAAPNQPARSGPAPTMKCDAMPEAGQIEAALQAAGFPADVDSASELTRRPLDLALAVSVGDPLLLAEVLEASDGERVAQQLQAWGADPRDLQTPEIQRAAIWLASCLPLDAAGRPANSAQLQAPCREHPALWQACMHQGLCDVRDLRDLLLRTMPADALGATERLARWLAPRMGR
ncbi:MAG: hypothetical protein HZC37_21890 [Burkholderiales bacterium]|nr:hypothetical protein [Burkholderiales bacterium]